MEALWEKEQLTARDLLEVLNRDGKDRRYTTALTIFQRLGRKGLVTRERAGRAHVYRAAMTKNEFDRASIRAKLDELVRRHGDLARDEMRTALGL